MLNNTFIINNNNLLLFSMTEISTVEVQKFPNVLSNLIVCYIRCTYSCNNILGIYDILVISHCKQERSVTQPNLQTSTQSDYPQ